MKLHVSSGKEEKIGMADEIGKGADNICSRPEAGRLPDCNTSRFSCRVIIFQSNHLK